MSVKPATKNKKPIKLVVLPNLGGNYLLEKQLELFSYKSTKHGKCNKNLRRNSCRF
jgi:hypothetical protein